MGTLPVIIPQNHDLGICNIQGLYHASDSPLLSTTQSMTKHNLMELRDFTIDSSIMELYWVNS